MLKTMLCSIAILCSTLLVIGQEKFRCASYNVALFRDEPGLLEQELRAGDSDQIKRIAAVIQNTRPDILALCEFDYHAGHVLAQLFVENYLNQGQFEQQAIDYPYFYQFPSNTGIAVPFDLNLDGEITPPNDAYGYGAYQGQYAFALFSRFPMDRGSMRSFQKFLWKDMPGMQWPKNPDGSAYYSNDIQAVFRLSSKNHIDMPVLLPNGRRLHIIVSHPTPPGFDGPEDRNGLRNNDEIKLIVDYLSGASYLKDDQGRSGGLDGEASFIVLGDLNADPNDGNSLKRGIRDLLDHPRVNKAVGTGKMIPSSKGGREFAQRPGDQGDPAHDTAFFGIRIDYVLPSSDLEVLDSGVFWPASGMAGRAWIEDKAASDHLLVWVDLAW